MLAGGSCRAGWRNTVVRRSLLFWLDIHCVCYPVGRGKKKKKKCSLFWWIYTKWAHPPEFSPDGARAPCLRQATRAKPWKGFSFSLKVSLYLFSFLSTYFIKTLWCDGILHSPSFRERVHRILPSVPSGCSYGPAWVPRGHPAGVVMGQTQCQTLCTWQQWWSVRVFSWTQQLFPSNKSG